MIVVAGVTGHVGSVVASELLAQGKKVKIIVRDSPKGVSWSSRGAEVAVGSLEDQAFLTRTLRGATAFFTLLPPNYQANDFFAFQRKTADAIAGAVKESGVPYVVMLSSIGADLESGTGPIKGLHYLENALRKTGAKVTAIRAGSFQENIGQLVAPAKQAGIFPSFFSADFPIPQIATKDIGKLAAESLARPPKTEVIDLVGPAYTNRQLAQKLGQALGKELTVVDVPHDGWIPTLVQAGLSDAVAPVIAEMYEAFTKGIVTPKGDRVVKGETTIDDTLPRVLGQVH